MKIAVVCPEPLREVATGIGIRCWHIALSLANHFDTTLFLPEGSSHQVFPGEIQYYRKEDIGGLVKAFSAVVVQGEPANFILAQPDHPFTVVDLYDPYMIEALSYDREAHHFAFSSLTLQIQRGDFFLCASQEQFLFYAGVLYGAGRLIPDYYQKDPELTQLLAIVPYGVEDTFPKDEPYDPTQWLGILPEGLLVFFGGFYDWYDPSFLIQVWDAMLQQKPAHLIITRHPREETTPQRAFYQFREEAEKRGWLSHYVHLIPWIPYVERIKAYRTCQVALSVYPEGFETQLSFRTRLLDFLWAGLPFVASFGGGVAATLRDLPGAYFVEGKSPEKFCQTLLAVAENPPDPKLLNQGIRNRFTWERVLVPLVERLKSQAPRPPLPWWKRIFG